MADTARQVRGLLVPLQGFRLVLPDSIVLQVVSGADIDTLSGAPTWLLGTFTWQKRVIPLLSFESTVNQPFEQNNSARVLVLKSISNLEKMPFYAIALSGIPRPSQLDEDNLTAVETASLSSPVILNEVLVDGELSSIPNLDALEEMIMSQYGLFAR